MSANANRRRGQILIMTTLITVPLFGMLGLVTDLGYMHYVKMTAQSAAEAAAQSAMVAFHKTVGGAVFTCGGNVVCAPNPTACPTPITTPTNPIEDGCMYAQAHGFTGANSVTYQTGRQTTPPTAPGMAPAAYWVTFRTYQTVPQLFSAVLGNFSGQVVGRSTAAIVGANDCIYALNPTNVGLSVGGTASLTSSCGIFVDSNNNCAISTNGTATLSAPEYDVVGNVCTSSTLTPAPNTGVSPASDPLASLAVPSAGPYSCPAGGISYPPPGTKNGDTITISPGTYCGGIQVKNNTVIFQPGTYTLVGGGLTTQDSNSTITGSGVMFYNTFDPADTQKAYNTYGPISIAANSSVTLTAPTTGTYAGMLFFDDRSAPTGNPDTYGGGATAVYQGIIYNSQNSITMYGNSSTNTQYTMVIAQTISMVGTTAFNNNYTSLPSGLTPLQKIAVVE